MPIPDFQTVMLPLLRDLSQDERNGFGTLEALAAHFGLTAEELAQRLPSGRAPTFANRAGWAKSHLKAAGREAGAYARSIQTTIVLVDGAQLAELMIDHGVGVTTHRRYEIKRLDSDYFAAE